MTKEQIDELIEKAKPYANLEIYLQIEYNTVKQKYIFVGIGNTVSIKEGDKTIYSISGKLKSENGEIIPHPLSIIVKEFEKIKH